jgi:hypothetical protein
MCERCETKRETLKNKIYNNSLPETCSNLGTYPFAAQSLGFAGKKEVETRF